MNNSIKANNSEIPQNIDAEVGVLGALLVEDEDIATEVIQMLDPNYFMLPSHKIIYEVMTYLYDNNKPLEPVPVQEELKKRNLLDQAGGMEYLISLMEAVPSAGNVEYYAGIVKEKAILRQLMKSGQEIVGLVRSGQMTTDEMLDKSEKLIFEVTQKKVTNEPSRIYELLLHLFNQIESNNQEFSTRISSGFADLDNMISGLQGSTLNIIAARPSMGKTSFVLNIAEHVGVQQNKGVLIFSLEMSKEQLAQNMVCAKVKLSPFVLKSGKIDQRNYLLLTTEAGAFAQAPIYIDDTPALTIRELRAKARRFKSRHDIQLIIIDYLQLMQGPEGGRENRQQEISLISRSLKGIARELDVPILALSQLNRAVDARDDHRPRMSDLRESGALEQDADVILFLYRDEYYNKDTNEPGIAEVIIAKNRTGPTGHIKLRFIKEYMKFLGLSYQKP